MTTVHFRPNGARSPRAHLLLLGLAACALGVHSASAAIVFDLRASNIEPGVGSIFADGKQVVLNGQDTGTVSLQIWAQVTNAAPTSNVFGVQVILGSIRSTSPGAPGVTGSMAGMLFTGPFNSNTFAGGVAELTTPADGILDLGSNATSPQTTHIRPRKDPTAGGTQVGAVFYASNLDPAGATVQPITNGFEFLMGTATFSIQSFTGTGGPFSMNWVIPTFSTVINRQQIANWTDGDGVMNNGNTNFAEMSVGAPINFLSAPVSSTWLSTGGGSWSEFTNWSAGVPNSLGTIANLGPAIAGPAAVTLDGDKSVASINLDSSNSYSIDPGSGGALSVGSGINVISGSHTIGAPLVLVAQNTSVAVANAGDTLTLSGAISGLGGLSKTGAGKLLVSGAGNNVGNTTVSAGTMELNATGANAISGNASVSGGTLRLLQSEQISDARNLAVTGGIFDLGPFAETVSGVQMTNGAIIGTGTLTSLTTFDVQNGAVSAALAGNVALNKTTGGTVRLSGANTYTGTTTVSGGVLELDTTGANAVAGNAAVAGGTLRWLQSNQIADTSNVTVTSGTFDLGVHSETVAGVQLTAGAIIGTGTLTSLSTYDIRSGTVAANLAGNVGLNKITASTATLSGANSYTGLTTVSAGVLELNTTGANAIAGNVGVTGPFSGTLRLLQGNQIADSSNIIVGSGLINSGTLDLGANSETVAGVHLSGGTISGSGVLTSLSDYVLDSGSISVRLAGNVGMSKATAGTATLSGANTYTGSTAVNAGVLQLNAPGANAIPGNVTVTGATLQLLQSNQIADTASVEIAGGTFDLNGRSETVAGVRLDPGVITGGMLTSLSDYDLRSGTVSAALGGNVGLNKRGAGTVTLAGMNSYTGLTTVSEGTLALGAAGNAIPGNVTVAGGTLQLQQSNQIANTGNLTILSGTFDFGSTETVASVQLSGGAITGTGALTSLSAFDLRSGSVSARLVGSVGVNKTTGGTVTLTGPNSYTGATTVTGGRLIVGGTSGSSSFLADGGAVLELDGALINLTTGNLRANSGGAIEYRNATINGGFLRGPGTHTLLAGGTNSFNGVTSFNSTTLIQNGAVDLTNFSNGGQITNGATLTWDGGVNSSSGRLTVNSAANVRDWTNDGVVVVSNGGVLSSMGSDLVSGGGSRITIESGGQMNIESGRSLDLQGSLLVNNGTIFGQTEVYYGATAKGGGIFGPVAVFDGGKFSPGNSPGTATINGTYTWGAGGSVDFEIFDAAGVAGTTTGWDLTKVIGSDGFLDIAAGTTANTRFTIHVASNDVNNSMSALNFDSSMSYQWLLVDTTQGVTGFDPAEIAIDASRFLNPRDGGSFSVSADSDRLYLNFTPVPEPTSAALWLTGLAVVGLRRRRRG